MSYYEPDDDYGEGKHGRGWKQIDFEDIELAEQIGGGGVGIVYCGRFNGRPVAVKTLFDPRVDEALKREYMDELLIMSSVDHPNIVKFHGACMTPPNLCFVMELCEHSVAHMLHSLREELSLRQLVSMAVDVAAAMNYLHSRSPPIIHRDLKSLNLLVGGNGRVKLCDFGLVSTRVTTAGTPAYMAPELLENKPFSKKVDVYAFGVLLWEFFTRQVPFYGEDPFDIKQAVSAGQRPRIPTIDTPQVVRDMIAECWAQDPDDRPDFQDVYADLQILLAEMPERSELDTLGDMGGDALDALLRM